MRNRREPLPKVVITKNADESAAIEQGLQLINLPSLINKDDVVVITCNWVNREKSETGIVVGYESLGAIIRQVKASFPKRVVVAAGSGDGETSEVAAFAGFDKVIQREGAEFIDLNHGPFVHVMLNHDKPAETNLNKIYEEMTFHISFTQLKVHEEATMSASIKNMALGWAPSEEHGFPKTSKGIHENLHGFIRAMAECVPIDLSIISANPAMVATGPAKGIPKHTELVIMGTDPVSADTIGARLLGYKPQAVRYIYECSKKNVGESSMDKINIQGLDIKEAERHFTQVVYGDAAIVDK